MLWVWGASKGNNVPGSGNPPSSTGVTYGGVAVPAVGLTGKSGDHQGRVYLLQDLSGVSGTDLVTVSDDKWWGAVWVIGSAEYIETVASPASDADLTAIPADVTVNVDGASSWGVVGCAIAGKDSWSANPQWTDDMAGADIGSFAQRQVGSIDYAGNRMGALAGEGAAPVVGVTAGGKKCGFIVSSFKGASAASRLTPSAVGARGVDQIVAKRPLIKPY